MKEYNRRVQFLVAVSVSFVAVAVGCYSAWPALAMPKFHDNDTNIIITTDEMAWMVAASSPGFMLGSLVMRHISDNFGRRTTILGTVLPAAVATIIVACATKPWLLYITRFLWGTASGMVGTVTGLYFAEIADKEIRGNLTLVTRFMFNFGNLLIMTIGPFVSYYTLNYMLLALPVIFFLACWWIPESPYYYLKEGRVGAARKTLRRLRGNVDEKTLEDELLQMEAQVKNEMRRSSTLMELLTGKQYRKAIVIVTGLKLTQMLAGQVIIQQYLGIIMRESRYDIKLSTVFIAFGAVRFTVGVMSSVLADRIGRRPLLIYSYLGSGISLAIVGLYFFLLEVIRIDHDTLIPYGFLTLVGILGSNIISTLGFNSLIAVIPAEIFPMNVKAIAVTTFSIFGALLNFSLSVCYQVVKDVTGLSGVFWIFAIVSFGGAVFSFFLVPETKGKSLREIQILLQGDLYEVGDVIEKLNTVQVLVDDDIESKELKVIKEDNGS